MHMMFKLLGLQTLMAIVMKKELYKILLFIKERAFQIRRWKAPFFCLSQC